MRFSEWIQIESFLDVQIREIALREAMRETFASVIKEARKALFHGTILESSDEEEEDERRKRLLLSIRNSISAIRTYGIIERRRLVDFMKEISEWISKSKQDDDLDDLKTDAFYEVLPRSDLRHSKTDLEKDTLEIAAVILKRLNYITASEESEIVGDLAEEGQKAEAAMEFLEDKVNRAASETGNEIDQGSVSFAKAKADYAKASEDLRRDTMELYRSNIERKAARDAGRWLATNQELYDNPNKRSPIKNVEPDELFNQFYLRLLKKAKERRKRRDGSFLPWIPENNDKSPDDDESSSEGNKKNSDAFQKALEDPDDEHLDRYLQRMIDSDSRTIRISRSRTRQTNPLPNMSRKKRLIEEDTKKDNLPTSMDFYKKYMEGGENDISSASDSEIENMKIGLENEDKIRIDILKDIKYISENNPRAKEFGISMDPDKIQDSLLGYMIHILNSRRERTETPFSQFARDKEGSSEDAVVASIQSSEFEDHMPKVGSEDSGLIDVTKSDSHDSDLRLSDRAFSGVKSIASGGMSIIEKFFRPYILNAIKRFAVGGAGGSRGVIQSIFLCIKYGVPCSFSMQNGEILDVAINENEIIDRELDEKIKAYLFEKLGSESDTLMSTQTWSRWSDEGHLDKDGTPKESQKTLHKDSFCSIFFTGPNSLYASSKTHGDIMQILTYLPETVSSGKTTYTFNPEKFGSSWTPSGKQNSLMKVDNNTKSPTYGQLVPIYRKSSVGEYLSGNPQGKRGAISYLCDMVFDMITKDEVSLKDIMMRKNQEERARLADIEAKRKREDDAYRSTLRTLPTSRPSLSSRPNPLGRFVRRQNPEEPSSP